MWYCFRVYSLWSPPCFTFYLFPLPLTLKIMLVVVIIFIPIVIGYQIWAYTLFKGKVTQADLAHDEAY